MKFEVVYNEWVSATKTSINRRLAVLDDLRDACHVAWALREVRRGKAVGDIMVFGTKRGHYEHGVDVCLGCKEDADRYRYSQNCPRTADELFARAQVALKKSIAAKQKSERRYRWLEKIVAPEHYVKSLGALGSDSPHYDKAFLDAFRADDLAKLELMLAVKGWLPVVADESNHRDAESAEGLDGGVESRHAVEQCSETPEQTERITHAKQPLVPQTLSTSREDCPISANGNQRRDEDRSAGSVEDSRPSDRPVHLCELRASAVENGVAA